MDFRRVNSSRRNLTITIGLALALFLLLFPSLAAAHAKLMRSEPQANATLKQAPKTIELWFSEALEHNFCAIVVTDQNGNRVDKNNISFPEGDKQLHIDLGELGAGTYTVEWKILSADQHSMKGSFTFTVASAGTPTASVSPAQHTSGSEHPEPSQQSAPSSEPIQQSGSSWVDSLARWLHHLAMMTLFGGFAFQLLVFGPALSRSRGMTDVEKAVVKGTSARRVILFSWLSLALLVILSLVELVMQSSTVFDKSLWGALSPSLLNQVISQTGFGASWRLQVWAIVALLITVFYLSRGVKHEPAGDHRLLWLIGLAASAVLFLAPAWTGHASAAAKEYPFATLTDWLHLVAGGFWVGGLFHLALTLPAALSNLERHKRLHVLHRIIPMFSRLAIASTVLIFLTGLYNSWMHVDGFGKLWSTAYGRTLSLKVLLVIPMLVLGGINTFIIHPRASRLLERAGDEGASDPARLSRSFSRSVRVEAVLGGLVLLVAAVLVFLQPAREHGMNTTYTPEQSVVTHETTNR